jgi:sugar phosphate isomerase/epimerase
MALSDLPLSYCTNVHPGTSVAEVQRGLDEFTVPLSAASGGELAAGLWLAQPVVAELTKTPGDVTRFADRLNGRGLSCHTLNAFPYGDFHSERVKEQVYLPDWSTVQRADYTRQCAEVLRHLLPPGGEGSISTVPLGFKGLQQTEDFRKISCDRLLELAADLDRLFNEHGKRIRLAIEPEPLCLLETTQETLDFFDELFGRAAEANVLEIAQQYLGVCYDVCHQSVEFEDVVHSISELDKHGVRVNKVHITCAIELRHPASNLEGRQALAQFVEPRYLHQTIARTVSGRILRAVDLTEELAINPPTEFAESDVWRIHFHVPVDAERMGPLYTTRPDLQRALQAVHALDYAPHLEVETYTWAVLPDGGSVDLVEGLSRELAATRRLLNDVKSV